MYAITGASSGLGLEVAKCLLLRGKKVTCLSSTDPKVKGLEYIALDITNQGSIEQAAAQLLAKKGKLKALIHCAGVFSEEPTSALTAPDVAKTFTTNAIGPLLFTARLLERLKKDNADIVTVASTAATKGTPGQITYSSSKWAMRGISQTLQAELKETGVRVINFCPGGMRTDFFKKVNGSNFADPENWMQPADVAAFLVTILELPKNMEVSEVVINRKPPLKK